MEEQKNVETRRIVLTPQGESWALRWERLEQVLDAFRRPDGATPIDEAAR